MQTNCPSCALYGFDPNDEGYLYFLTHSNWQMLQIGITNLPEDRINRHKRNGWEIIEVRGPMDGVLTRQWETAILRMLKAKGADLSNSKIAGKFDGYSEAWSKSTFPVKSIKELMRLTEEFEEKL
jgi:predicted GIY-YIG superfamily endonuclease